MGFSRLSIILSAISLFTSGLVSGQTIHPLGQTIFDFDYEYAYRQAIEKQSFSFLPVCGPFFTNQITAPGETDISTVSHIFDERGLDSLHLRLFTIGTEKWHTQRNQKGDDLPSFMGGFVYRPFTDLAAIGFFNLDRAKAIDPEYTGKKYRGLAGQVETVILTYRHSRLAVTFGRQRLFWGPQPINLVISKTTEPLDLLTFSYHAGRIDFNFLFARLDKSHPDSIDLINFPGRSFGDNRYIAAHRLDIRLHKRFRLGLFETTLFGGEGRPPELYYLNPLQFFHSSQLNENIDDNTMLGIDYTALLGKGISTYGQLLVDDFQIDDKSQGDQEPNEYGIMAGIFKTGRIGTFLPDIKAEYVRITNRTYHQYDPRNRYLYQNKLIGHPLGPDADSLSLTLRFWPNKQFFAEIEVAYRRHGEGSVFKPWDAPWADVTGDYHEPFPTGIVEKATLAACRVQGYPPFGRYIKNHFFLSLDGGWGELKNHNNIAGKTATTTWLYVSLSWLAFANADVSD